MAHIYRLIFSLFLVFYSSASFALVPKTFSDWKVSNSESYYPKNAFSSPQQAIDAGISAWNARWPGYGAWCEAEYPVYSSSGLFVGYDCRIKSNVGSHGFILVRGQNPFCPSNSSPSGSQCACNSGYEEKNGQCELPPPPDSCQELNEFCAGQFMKETSWETSGKSRPGSVCVTPKMQVVGGSGGFASRFPGCSRGCSIETYPGIVSSQNPFDDSWKVSGDGKYNGQSCNADSSTVTPEEPKPEEPKPEDEIPCKNGEFSGHVSGIKTCLPSKAKDTDGTTTKKTNSDGSTTETTSKTTCSNGSCNTTITTVNKDSSGAITGTSTEEVKETEGEFCQKNPASPLCKKSDSGTSSGNDGKGEGEEDGQGSEFGGSCSSGFTCEGGDGIACAIAKKQHEDSCALNEATDESALYQQSKDKDGNVTGDLEGNSTHQFTQIKSNSRFSASSCVQDLNITVWGTSVEVPLSKVCPWLSNLGYVLVAVAWIMAAAIVMRGR